MYGFLVGLSLLMLCNIVSAQEKRIIEAKNSFAFVVGAGFPLSNYGNNVFRNQSAGLAQTGTLFEISYKRNLNKDMGISVLYRTQFNKINRDRIYSSIQLLDPIHIFNETADKWELNNIMLGLYAKYPFNHNNRLSVLLHFHAGLSMVTLPDIEFAYMTKEDKVASFNNHLFEENSEAICLMLGTGLQYKLSSKINLSLNTDLFYTNPAFELPVPVGYNGKNADVTRGNFSYSQNITIAALSFGIMVLF